MLDAYQRAAPELLDATDPIHPASSPPSDAAEWRAGVAGSDGLGEVEVRDYEWSETYSAADYAALLQTHSTVRVLDPARRSRLVGAMAHAIESQGDRLELPIVTRRASPAFMSRAPGADGTGEAG